MRAEVLAGIGTVLLVLGATRPRLLAWPSAVWWRFSRALGYVNARVLLTLLFALILVPVSLIWRLLGKDPLRRGRAQFDRTRKRTASFPMVRTMTAALRNEPWVHQSARKRLA